MIEYFESITDEEAKQMPELFKQLREAYLQWKTTMRLPSGEIWKPPEVSSNE